jgi:hypothetical protein
MRELSRDDATEMGKTGGKRRAEKLSAARRKEISAAAVAARWKKFREKNTAEPDPSKEQDSA